MERSFDNTILDVWVFFFRRDVYQDLLTIKIVKRTSFLDHDSLFSLLLGHLDKSAIQND